MLDSIHYTTPERLQLGEGLLMAGVDPVSIVGAEDPAALLAQLIAQDAAVIGATRKGCTFACAPAIFHTEERGQRTPTAQGTFAGAWTATLSGTLLEVTGANAARLLNTVLYGDGSRITLTGNIAALPESMAHLCWIGTTGEGLMLIGLRNPLSIGGMRFVSGHRGVGETPFIFLARQDGPQDTALPFSLHWIKEATA